MLDACDGVSRLAQARRHLSLGVHASGVGPHFFEIIFCSFKLRLARTLAVALCCTRACKGHPRRFAGTRNHEHLATHLFRHRGRRVRLPLCARRASSLGEAHHQPDHLRLAAAPGRRRSARCSTRRIPRQPVSIAVCNCMTAS